MTFAPIHQLIRSRFPLIEVANRLIHLTTIEGSSEVIAILIVGNTDILLVFREQHGIITTSSIKNLTIVVHRLVGHILPESITFGRQTDVLGCIPTDAIHATRLQLSHILLDFFLYTRILGLQVPHTKSAMRHLPTIAIVDTTLIIVIQTLVLPERSYIAQVAIGMVCHHIHDDLDTILMGFGTEFGQSLLGSQTILTHLVVVRLIEHIPWSTNRLTRMSRRSLNSREPRRRNIRQLLFDLFVRPVKTVQDDTILDIVFQTIFVVRCKSLQGDEHEQ